MIPRPIRDELDALNESGHRVRVEEHYPFDGFTYRVTINDTAPRDFIRSSQVVAHLQAARDLLPIPATETGA